MFIKWLNDGLSVFFLSMLPITELRGSIPYGIFVLGMTTLSSFIWSVLGNNLIIIPILKFLNPTVNWLFKHSAFLQKHLKIHFEKLHHKHSMKFNELGAVFLALFVAVPLPGTGAWTGALLAYLFNIPFWLAFSSISVGVLGAGILVAFFSGSVSLFLSHFL